MPTSPSELAKSKLAKSVARFLRMPVEQIDGKRLRSAALSVQRTDQTYWDALANSGQLHGNVPHGCMVAMVYDWSE